MSNFKFDKPAKSGKPVEVAPGMFRSPTPVSKEAAKLETPEAEQPQQDLPTPPSESVPTPDTSVAQTEPTAPTATPPADAPDMEGCIKYARSVRDVIITKWAGKPGVNPYIFVREQIDPLLERAKRGDTSNELKQKLLALSTDMKPVVNVPVMEK